MGLRRTPPPGMAAPPPPPENYMTEYPEEQVHVQVEATPTATPAEEEASVPPPASAPESSQQQPYTTSQVHRSSSQITGTPVGAAGSADAAMASANTPLAIASSGGGRNTRSAQGTPTPAPPNKPVRRSPVARSAPAPATPTPPPPREPDAAAAAPAAPPSTTTTTTTTTPPPQATPQRNLLTLAAGLNRAAPPPTTPHHHPPPRPHPSARRTPGAHRLAPKLTARSPHAIRAFTRRAATPARRRSMRYAAPARESPRDWLLKLSGILAPTTAPFVPTPVQTPRVREEEMLYFSDPGEDGEEEEEEERPRTEVNFYDDGEEGWEVLVRPEARSVERGRRAVSEQPWGGGRASFGITWDDRFADLDALREQAGEGETTQVADVSMGLGDVTVGGISVGEESLGRVARMGFVPEEEEEDEEDAEGDVTMGMERGGELPFDEGDSYFFPMPAEGSPAPAPAHDSDTDSDTGLPLDYSVPSPDADLDSDNDAAPTAAAPKTQKPRRKQHPLSRHGHPLPPFPRATIKKMAQTFLGGGASIGGEALEALVRASDAFWEQAAGDLAAYAGHAGRRTIEEGDVVVLMGSGRQRVITEGATLFSLAQRHLPRELLQQVRMPVVKSARGKGKGKGKGKGAAKGKGKAVEGGVEAETEEEGAET
ncbi:centromere kinetochore component CENP-T-domain-containing protein [Morchella snyderi]|nr:centromere kinetochore component CENP-T-domain-containing protein [Morchella snyderi]